MSQPDVIVEGCLRQAETADLFAKWLEYPFKIGADATIMELMEKVEEFVELVCTKKGDPVEFQIQVMWNIKNNKKALNPGDKVKLHFGSGCGSPVRIEGAGFFVVTTGPGSRQS
ncbi:unnamed protein product [Effrenium voratum]|nr:unnamed protein product [Effrenium voratum]